MKEKLVKCLKSNVLFLTFIISSLINSFLLRAFTVKNYLSFKPILADIVIILVVAAIGYAVKNPKRRFIYYMVWLCLFTILCIANSIYFTNYRSFISLSYLSTASQLGGVMDAVTESILEVKDLVFLWAIPVFVAVYILLRKKKGYFENVTENQNRKKSVIYTLATAGVCAVIFCTSLTSTDLSRLVKQWNREYVLSRFGLYTYQISDTVSSIKAKINVLFGYEENREVFDDFYEDKEKKEEEIENKDNDYTDVFEGKNVIVIHAESIQNFCLGTFINGEELTPNLNKLASEGLYFKNFYSQESVGTSSDSEFTFSTSLMPASSGTVAINYWDREYVTIQKLLGSLGYYTFSMHGNNGSYWNRLNLHSSFGYDDFFNYETDFVIDETIGLGLSDKSFFRQAAEKIADINAEHDKFYGTLIMLTNHTPFTDIENHSDFSVTFDYMKLNEETGEYELYSAPFLEGTKLGSYLKSVHYADEAIGQLIEDLDSEGILDDTVIVVYGDHDSKIKEEYYETYFNYNPFTEEVLDEDDEGYIPVNEFAYNVNRSVPFIIWSKGGEAGHKVIDEVMGMYDCLPTLGNMFGFENKFALGRDIFSLNDSEENLVIFPTGNFVTDTVYYNSQNDSYFDLTDYSNVVLNAPCNQYFKNMKPEEIYAEDYPDYKTTADPDYSYDAFQAREDNGVVDEEYLNSRNEEAELEITISNAIIYYDMIKRVSEEEGLDAIQSGIASLTVTSDDKQPDAKNNDVNTDSSVTDGSPQTTE